LLTLIAPAEVRAGAERKFAHDNMPGGINLGNRVKATMAGRSEAQVG
jgi:hypothetical protein